MSGASISVKAGRPGTRGQKPTAGTWGPWEGSSELSLSLAD